MLGSYANSSKEIVMRIISFAAIPLALVGLSAASASASATTQAGPPTCHPVTPPADPNSTDGNPGYGGTAGLNSDFHDEFDDPLDHPGQVIGPLNREVAQSGAPGGNHLLQDGVGNDCPKG